MTEQMKQPEPAPQPQPQPTPTPEPEPTPTPEPPNPYQTIIEQKDAQISALLEQTNKLTEQITKMINAGTQINDGTEEPKAQSISGNGFAKGNQALSDDDDYSVSALGNLIGKR